MTPAQDQVAVLLDRADVLKYKRTMWFDAIHSRTATACRDAINAESEALTALAPLPEVTAPTLSEEANSLREIAELADEHGITKLAHNLRVMADNLEAHEAQADTLRDAVKNFLAKYEASAPGWWPTEVDDLEFAVKGATDA